MSVSLEVIPIKTDVNLSTNSLYALLVFSEHIELPLWIDQTFQSSLFNQWLTARLAFYKRKHPYYYHRMQMRRNPDYEDEDL
jgi:hypothetical protein